ncbi:hypothetical protein [Nitrosovibrio sp. Nv17]|uniref:hypothetical protein n=1 Tax=Nitrosovibrio sp. Nv17 TaxID=1855339 RepID=UPI0009087FE9|nr:hypothetical protein [Nitrosovibrio sp. Nv17]SFW26946.1 hypothetical protein SAMN05216414_11037 [Nitrosovibrio sp. Nv17]
MSEFEKSASARLLPGRVEELGEAAEAKQQVNVLHALMLHYESGEIADEYTDEMEADLMRQLGDVAHSHAWFSE